MKKLSSFGLAAAAALSTVEVASAADFDPLASMPSWAANGFIEGGGAWNDGRYERDVEVASIVAGGDIVLPLSGNWNIQIGGTGRWDESVAGPIRYTNRQFQGDALAFWRDEITGVFGIDVGFFSPAEDTSSTVAKATFLKVGGVAEYFIGETATIGGFGGVLVPIDDSYISTNLDELTGFYAGGHATFYASKALAISALAKFTERTLDFGANQNDVVSTSLRVGGKVRYLSSMNGVELYGYAGYNRCQGESKGPLSGPNDIEEGFEVLAGVEVYLGGRSDSLVTIDRSNAIDTRAWACILGDD